MVSAKPKVSALKTRTTHSLIVVHNVRKTKSELNKIPKNIKYSIFGISALIFFSLNSMFGINLIIGTINLIQKITGYHFGISTNTLDYLTFATIPIFGMILNSKRNEFKVSELIVDIISILFWSLIVIGIGLFLLIYFGRSSNPLVPEYLLIEPFDLYSTLLIGIGIGTPFLLIKRNKKMNEINEIRVKN